MYFLGIVCNLGLEIVVSDIYEWFICEIIVFYMELVRLARVIEG
jgi:hypothetical protein